MAQFVSKRPWGNFIQYCQNESVTVKIITVNPGEALSVQYHENRDELWIILDEGLVATIDSEDSVGEIGTQFFVHRRSVHSIRNESTQPARFLEICFGEFDEEDIIRLSDKYGRN